MGSQGMNAREQSILLFSSRSLSFVLLTRNFITHTFHIVLTFITTTMASAMSRSHSQNNVQASANYKEAFALFDKRGNGRVALESLGDLLRACGQNPTIAEVRELEKGVGGDCELCLPAFGAVLAVGVVR
jgi:hypothetical protein